MAGTLTGRVASVRPRPDGLYGVTLATGRPDHILWFVTEEPARLGELISIGEPEMRHAKITRDDKSTIVSTIEGGDLRIVPEPFARRLVPTAWLERVRALMARRLYAYQAEGAAWLGTQLATHRGGILADDAGTGKTSQTIAAIVAAGALPAIVICPASVKHNWVREIGFCRLALKTFVVNGSAGVLPPAHILIANYEVMRPREAQLSRLGARCIVFDEGHRLKEPYPQSSHRAAVATRLAHRIGRPVILTGTPLLNRPEDLWRLLHIVDPQTWPQFAAFKKRYCTRLSAEERQQSIKSIVTNRGKVKHLDELRVLTDPLILRREKGQVLRDLPAKSRRSILVDLEPYDRRNYDAAAQDVIEWLRQIGSDRRALNAARAKAIVKLTMLRRIAAIAKLRKAAPEYIAAWFSRKDLAPLVVFAYHRDVLQGVKAICRRFSLRISSIAGSDPHDERLAAVDRFQRGETDVFVAPIQSAGLGINLQRASDVLFLERMWTPSLMSQAESRVERIGQRRPVTATYLDAVDTVDEHIAAVINTKQLVIDRVVDDKDFDDDVESAGAIDEVIRMMRSRQ